MQLEGKIALVTGAAGRLGKVLARHLYDEGAVVVAVDLPGKDLSAVIDSMVGDRKKVALSCNVAEPASVNTLVDEAEAAVGQIDLLVNCHGLATNYALVDMTPEQWDAAFAVNARGTFLLGQAYARQWIERGIKGVIVNISSGASTSARAGNGHYAGSKAAVNMLTQTQAIEFGPYGIRANAISPGVIIDRVITEERDDQHPYLNMSLRGTPLRRTGEPMDIAKGVVFLASEQSSWITGVVLPISGGSHAGRTHVPFSPIEQLV